jgi:hypothetical protein
MNYQKWLQMNEVDRGFYTNVEIGKFQTIKSKFLYTHDGKIYSTVTGQGCNVTSGYYNVVNKLMVFDGHYSYCIDNSRLPITEHLV